jgi:ubiquinone/menaquinone biosynthesis C-methylase UbiE
MSSNALQDEAADFKQGMRAAYAEGRYEKVAELERESAARFVSSMDITPGLDVLDVGTGTGNVAIPAATAGGRVVGVDLSSPQLEAARRRAERDRVEVEWLVGDAEALPFADASFDRVLSAFAVMFAPRHERAAAELVRVCRPGGLIGVCSWTPDSVVGALMNLVEEELPPRPGYAMPPLLWGEREHVERLFKRFEIELRFNEDSVKYEFGSPEAYVEFFEENFGPLVLARRFLSAVGKWHEMRPRMIELLSVRNEARDGSFSAPMKYLVTIGRKPVR